MTKFEFDNVMEYFGQSQKKYHLLYGRQFHYDDMGSTVVRGNIPLELAKRIYNNYDSWDYGIRANGELPEEEEEPTSDVQLYQIDSAYGLTSFILELAYYEKQMQCPLSQNDYTFQAVNNKMLKNVNTKMSSLNEEIDTRVLDNPYEFELSKRINDFDFKLHPFQNLDLDEYESLFEVKGYGKNNYSLYHPIDDIEYKISKTNYSFSNKLIIRDADPYITILEHSYDDNGEKVTFDYYSEYGTLRFTYNFTFDVYTNVAGDAYPATELELAFIISIFDTYLDTINKINEININLKNPEKGFEHKLK